MRRFIANGVERIAEEWLRNDEQEQSRRKRRFIRNEVERIAEDD
jgi:hypothetical protein